MSETHKDKDNQKDRGESIIRHVFDGIEEEDNDLPRWWLNMFYVTIVFSVFYMAWFHWPIGKGLSPEEIFAKQTQAISERRELARAEGNGFDYQTLLGDPATIAEGKAAYDQVCIPCHGIHGEGSVGPNLTDDYWIIEPTLAAVEEIIATGNLEKGMPGWEPIIGLDRVRQIVAYIVSIQGSDPPNAREPQGEPGILE